ncbi:hypothetical protein JMM81_15750 [Bacillus sp. V3B]|uniref:hypothetical protein n=1 Tax=Bacillus sp. V3B TaxID=2804915 RepID=UPI00210A2DC1|nr:hypothetical protein [Bacillus sp. V3B]MCQ6276369.1 hypothetical protein [Bacillus sp. V3B]
MDGQILANSIVSLKGNDLRMVYALLCKTNIGHLLSSKTKDLFSKEGQDHFTKHLEEEVKKIENKEDQELQVDLFLELTELLKLKGRKYTLQQDIEDQCITIVNEVYDQYQKQDKQFRSFVESGSSLTKLQQMIRFQMSKVFRELDGSFQDFTVEDQMKFASQVNEYIHSLSEEKKIIIQEELDITELTDEMIRKAITTSGTSRVFAIIAEVSGSAFYSTVTSLVTRFAGLFGLTFPFGFYTGVTSTIAVLTNPLFIFPLLIGGGAIIINQQNKSLKKKLLPIILLQLSLPYMSGGEDAAEFEPFIQEWARRYNQYRSFHVELDRIEKEQKELRDGIHRNDTMIKDYEMQIDEELEKIGVEKQHILSALIVSNLDALDISSSFEAHKKEYQEVVAKIKELRGAKEKQTAAVGFLRKIGSKLTNFTNPLDILEEEKKVEPMLDKMVNDVLLSKSSFVELEREQIHRMERKVNKLKRDLITEKEEKQMWETGLRNLNEEHDIYMEQIKQLENENYGLADLIMSQMNGSQS